MKRKVTRIVESLIGFCLLIIQYVPVMGIWHGVMFFPLAIYFFSLLVIHPESFLVDMNFLLFSSHLMVGRIIAFAGVILFLAASIQFLRMRGRLITTGLYSVVRHPQYFGIIVATFGYSLMLIQVAPFLEMVSKILFIWIIQVLGYISLAFYEERHLLSKHGDAYKQFKRKVPFIFPCWHPSKIPEPIFSFIITLIIALFCMLPFV